MPATTTTLTEPTDAVTVRHLRVGGSRREIGRALAAAAHDAHGELARPPRMDPSVERVRRRWFALHDPGRLELGRGIADHFGLDPADESVALDWLGTHPLPAGCSVGFFPGTGTKDGHGVLARNFDFPTLTLSGLIGLPDQPGERPLGGDPWLVESRPDDGYASVTVGMMDVVGAMDGVNEAGLAVALLADNETPDPEPTGSPQVGLAEQQVVRHLLDTCATAEEALDALRLAKHYYFFVPCHYVVADRSGRAFVWEHSPRRNREVAVTPESAPELAGRLVCTNHLLHRWPDSSALPWDQGPVGTAALSYDRWRHLAAANVGGPVVDREDIAEQFAAIRFTAPIEEARTFWHATYDVDTATAEVSFFRHDAEGRSIYGEPVRVAVGSA